MTAPKYDALPYKLAALEGRLSALMGTYNAMMAARSLVTDALHAGAKAHEMNAGNESYDPSSVYHAGYQSLEFITRTACRQIVESCAAFMEAAGADPMVLAELQRMHAITPLGHVWTNEEYPAG